MNFSDINPYIRFAQQRHWQESYPHAVLAYDFRMFYGISGRITVTTPKQQYHITANTFVIIPPACPYRLLLDREETEPHSFGILNFDMTCHRADHKHTITPQTADQFDTALVISREAPPELTEPAFFEGDFQTGELFRRILDIYIRRPHLYHEECGALLKLILTLTHRSAMDRDNRLPKLVEKVMGYVHANYNKDITNASIAQHFLYHPNYVNRVFKEAMGESLHRYMIHYRLKIAKSLLTGTDNSIDEIARAVGFDSPSYFSKYFKQYFGESPLAFRANHIKNLL